MSKLENNLNSLFNWSFLYQYKFFFNQFFSYCYHFTEDELLKFRGKLVMGNPQMDFDGSYIYPNYGLIYNQNIRWTNNLILNYHADLQNVTDVLLPLTGHYEIQFIDLPLDSKELIDNIIGLNQSIIIDGNSFSEEDSHYNLLDEEIKNNVSYFSDVLNQKEFSSSDLINCITNFDDFKYYLSNNSFCENVMMKLVSDIEDFRVDSFYSNFD